MGKLPSAQTSLRGAPTGARSTPGGPAPGDAERALGRSGATAYSKLGRRSRGGNSADSLLPQAPLESRQQAPQSAGRGGGNEPRRPVVGASPGAGRLGEASRDASSAISAIIGDIIPTRNIENLGGIRSITKYF